MHSSSKGLNSNTSELCREWDDQKNVPGFSLKRLERLALPKGVDILCEESEEPARFQLVTPYVTLYYATENLARTSWKGIMHKVCPLLQPLRSKAAITGTKEDREKRQYALNRSKRALLELCKEEARKNLIHGEYELSVPGANQGLKLAKEVYGEQTINVVPSYLLIAEAKFGLKEYSEAEQYLKMANWIVSKNNEDCSNSIRSQLHRNFGKLYSEKLKIDDALHQLALSIYYASLDVGPEHVLTASGYYHMADLFLRRNKIENALAFYDKVVELWYKFLANVKNMETTTGNDLTETQLLEAADQLKAILNIREKFLGEEHIATGEVLYTLGLLSLFLGDTKMSRTHVERAVKVYKDTLGINHPSTKDAKQVLQQLVEKELFAKQS
eukprot:g2661.t1